MEVGVGEVDKVSIGRDVCRRRKQAQARVFHDAVAAGAIFPHGSFGPSVSLGDIEELLVRGDGDAVRAVDVSRHQAGARLILDLRPFRTEAQENDLVGGFADYVDKVVLLGGFTGWTYALR